MTIKLKLPSEVELRLQQEAAQIGVPSEVVALRLLEQHLPPPADTRHVAAVTLLEIWMEEDGELSAEEAASNAEVLHRLDEDRPSHRKLFADLNQRDVT